MTEQTNLALMDMWTHGHSKNTQLAYRKLANDFFQGCGKHVRNVTTQDIQLFISSLSHLRPSSRNRSLAGIKSLFAFAAKMDFIDKSPASIIRRESAKDTLSERILSDREVQAMIAMESDPRNVILLRLLYNSGCRVGELCGLRWSDIQSCNVVTLFGKDGTRSIRIDSQLWRDVLELKSVDADDSTPVFVSRKRLPLSPCQAWRIVRTAAERAGIERNVSPHWLRHTHATEALNNGAKIHVVCKQLGHSSLSTTGKYLHTRPDESSSDFVGG